LHYHATVHSSLADLNSWTMPFSTLLFYMLAYMIDEHPLDLLLYSLSLSHLFLSSLFLFTIKHTSWDPPWFSLSLFYFSGVPNERKVSSLPTFSHFLFFSFMFLLKQRSHKKLSSRKMIAQLPKLHSNF
jgi:hypothetical protein